MVEKTKKTVDELGKEKLGESIHESIGKVELIIESRSSRPLYIRATQKHLVMEIQWGRAVALLLGSLRFIKFWT